MLTEHLNYSPRKVNSVNKTKVKEKSGLIYESVFFVKNCYFNNLIAVMSGNLIFSLV